MKIISDRNKLPIAQASDIDRAAPEGKGAKWAQTNLHQNPDLQQKGQQCHGRSAGAGTRRKDSQWPRDQIQQIQHFIESGQDLET